MKKSMMKFFALATLGIGMMLIQQSCNKCKNVDCKNGGTCNKGTCTCATGYSGANCETKDPCLGITCQNGGTCSSGTCNCPAGYSGSTCATETRAVFLGNYTAFTPNCPSQASGYTQTISKSTFSGDKILISNFDNHASWSMSATVLSSTSLTLTKQTGNYDGTTNWTIESSQNGTLNGNQLTLYLKYTNESTLASFTCTAIMNKQ